SPPSTTAKSPISPGSRCRWARRAPVASSRRGARRSTAGRPTFSPSAGSARRGGSAGGASPPTAPGSAPEAASSFLPPPRALPAYVGKGLGTDAMNALVDFGFGELMLERIGLVVDPENARAIASYEKCGFTREGVMRAFRRHRGRISDALVMSITRPEWDALD